LPDLSGVDTFIHLKKVFSELGKEVPVICHTADKSDESSLLYQTAGFSGVLFKPIDPVELSRIIMTWLPEGKEGRISEPGDTADTQKELDLLPDWLRQIPELNPEAGIDHCETAEDYIDALWVFYSSISEKLAEIEDFFKKKDYGMYALRLHSLKSIAGLIGADILADLAASLEKAGKRNDQRLIREKHMAFITQYRAFLNSLAPLSEGRTDEDV
jgi:HPt (histidine-containing phosphotransfer) domain-containing protein